MGLEVPAEQIDGTSNNTTTSNAATSSLSDALVSVGTAGRGGTGSFVSPEGLIVTNWHVAYDAVRRASIDASASNDNDVDYVRDGFVARSRRDEIEGPNYECWITEECIDVSAAVLKGVVGLQSDAAATPLERANKIRDARQEIAQEAQKQRVARNTNSDTGTSATNTRCDVVEMIPNKSYVLFTYKRLRDVRIVYVPPKSLGGFGGDTDNFEWPRHTADFTLLRAYVPPEDGSSSKGSSDGYHPDNVPYDSSKAFIRVRKPTSTTTTTATENDSNTNTNDIQENDVVFLLGFPGSTMRYAPSSRLIYADAVDVPHKVRDFTKKLQWIAKHERLQQSTGSNNNGVALKVGATKKGLANELKRSRGKLVMMRKLKLIAERKVEEEQLVQNSDDHSTDNDARAVLKRLEEIYATFRTNHRLSSTLDSLRGIYGGSSLLATGHHVHEFLVKERSKPDAEREVTYRKRNLPFLVQRLTKRLRDVHPAHEADLVKDCARLWNNLSNDGSDNGNDDEVLSRCREAMGNTILADEETATNAVTGNYSDSGDCSKLLAMIRDDENVADLLAGIFFADDENDNGDNDTASSSWLEDPFVQVAAALWEVYKRNLDGSKSLMSERDSLFAKLLECQQCHSKDDSDSYAYPDCNGSLRISAGYVEGYTASDAVVHTPVTTLAGLYDKATEARLLAAAGHSEHGNEQPSEYNCPDRLYRLLDDDETGEAVQKVPVCLLYSTDTVGGNSGSPVMNKRGELVAINFDRQRQGLMNEYKWSRNYSRSIGVDVRYILWLIGEYDGADHLVEELISTD